MTNNNIRHKSLRLRIYPNKSQEILINKTFGCCRLIYNLHLEEKINYYEQNVKEIKDKLERNKIYKFFKPKTEKEWSEQFEFLSEVSKAALQQSRMNCDKSFQRFFSKKSKFPKFKSKKNNHQSYREVQVKLEHLDFDNQRIQIPKLKSVKFRNKDKPKWFNQIQKLCSITVEKTPSGKYFAVCLFEIENKIYPTQNRIDSVGLDFSPELCYVDSNGNNAKDNFGYIAQKQAHHKQLRKYQRKLARKHKGSKNYEKARIKLARLEEHVANCRKDWIEKETLRLVTNYNKVVVEDLNLIGISKFLSNAKNMTDTSWRTFVERLIMKSENYNCSIIKVDRYFPSSQLCSNCGYQYHELKLYMRKWICPNCHKEHVRDVNAAINLKNYIPKELRESMPVEDMEALASLALEIAEYPMKQEYAKSNLG